MPDLQEGQTNGMSDDRSAAGLTESTPAAPSSPGPVGQGDYEVQPGDCLASIALEHGHFWKTLWELPENAQLRQERKDPYVLLPGDRLSLIPLRLREETGATEKRHRFRRKGVPEELRVRVLRDDKPRANQPYTLFVDGAALSGTTDEDGKLSQAIPPDAKRALLRVGREPNQDTYELALGDLDPISELRGIQGRLNALGFDCGPADGKWGPHTEAAVRKYQRIRRLSVTGQTDEATRNKLKDEFGC